MVGRARALPVSCRFPIANKDMAFAAAGGCFGEYFASAAAIDKIFVHVLKLVARPLPWRNRVERRAIQFLVVAVRDSNRAALSIQIRAHHTQFACELIGSVRGDLQIPECKSALIPAVVPNHEIKIIVRHPKPSLRFALYLPYVCVSGFP